MMIITIILAYPPYRRRRQVSRRALTAPPIRRRSRAASRHGRVTARMRARPDDFPSALHPVPINNCVTPRRDPSATSPIEQGLRAVAESLGDIRQSESAALDAIRRHRRPAAGARRQIRDMTEGMGGSPTWAKPAYPVRSVGRGVKQNGCREGAISGSSRPPTHPFSPPRRRSSRSSSRHRGIPPRGPTLASRPRSASLPRCPVTVPVGAHPSAA